MTSPYLAADGTGLSGTTILIFFAVVFLGTLWIVFRAANRTRPSNPAHLREQMRADIADETRRDERLRYRAELEAQRRRDLDNRTD